MAELTRCVAPGVTDSGRMRKTCVPCQCRTVPQKDGAPVMCGRIDPAGYCQDRIPSMPFLLWVPRP